MTTTVSFSASMRTRKSNSSSNSKSSQACQEFYTSGYNYVGILHFSGWLWCWAHKDGIPLEVVSSGSVCFRGDRQGLLR